MNILTRLQVKIYQKQLIRKLIKHVDDYILYLVIMSCFNCWRYLYLNRFMLKRLPYRNRYLYF